VSCVRREITRRQEADTRNGEGQQSRMAEGPGSLAIARGPAYHPIVDKGSFEAAHGGWRISDVEFDTQQVANRCLLEEGACQVRIPTK